MLNTSHFKLVGLHFFPPKSLWGELGPLHGYACVYIYLILYIEILQGSPWLSRICQLLCIKLKYCCWLQISTTLIFIFLKYFFWYLIAQAIEYRWLVSHRWSWPKGRWRDRFQEWCDFCIHQFNLRKERFPSHSFIPVYA